MEIKDARRATVWPRQSPPDGRSSKQPEKLSPVSASTFKASPAKYKPGVWRLSMVLGWTSRRSMPPQVTNSPCGDFFPSTLKIVWVRQSTSASSMRGPSWFRGVCWHLATLEHAMPKPLGQSKWDGIADMFFSVRACIMFQVFGRLMNPWDPMNVAVEWPLYREFLGRPNSTV